MLSNEDETRSQKRKKKKKGSVPLEGLEADYSESMNECGGELNQEGDTLGTRKKRKTRRTQKHPSSTHRKHPETIITAMLEELNDDVVEDAPRKRGYVTEESSAASPSRQSDSVFVECRNGFSATPRAKLFHPMSVIEEGADRGFSAAPKTPLALAILVQKCTRPVYTFCHGMLAGMALFHIILVYGAGTEASIFISNYVHYARIYQTLFFLLSVVCTVSVLDRCDMGDADAENILELFNYGRSSMFAILLYLFSVIITSTTALWDDQIALLSYSGNFTVPEYDMQIWRDLNLSRSLAAIAGWMVVAFFPSEDMFHVHLMDMMRYKEGNEITASSARY